MQDTISFDYKRYLRLLYERRVLCVVVALLVATAAIVFSYSLPKQYKASSTVFIESNVINELVKGIAVTPSMQGKVKALSVTMLSRTMLSDVAKELDLDLKADTPKKFDVLVDQLRDDTRIQLNEAQGVFIISFTNRDPRLARDFVNSLTRNYIESSTSEKREESYQATQFLADQIAVFKGRIDDAQKNIDTFTQERGALLSRDEGALRGEIQNLTKRKESLQLQQNELLARRNVLLLNTTSNTRLKDMQNSMRQLQVNYTDSYPKVVRLRQEIAELKTQAEKNRPAEESVIKQTPEYEQLRIQIASVSSEMKTLETDIASKQELLHQIPPLRTEYNELVRKKQNEETIYQKLVNRYSQSEVSKQMELQDKSVTFRVMDPAVLPTSPVSPNRVLLILVGILGGIGLAVGLVVGLDLINNTVKDVATLEETGLPVLAVVGRIVDPDQVAAARRTSIRLAVVGGAYACLVLSVLVLEGLKSPLMDKLVSQMLQHLT